MGIEMSQGVHGTRVASLAAARRTAVPPPPEP